ncbi:hypothetical protein [Streptomyces sp. H27-H5]|uniref:hypothetical protein n=1 Tax=Streptomyces sp. H27-H5 TaxID=2996460 RepID=UPI00226FCCC3|nr:hypothetical protein [Streptomyces sp. H27-H5]MCY0957748.1 hypothetical protein [Streptomyces sp. H27-H5]
MTQRYRHNQPPQSHARRPRPATTGYRAPYAVYDEATASPDPALSDSGTSSSSDSGTPCSSDSGGGGCE